MSEKVVLLVEDNPDDEMLTLRALEKSDLPSRVVVVRDGIEALDYFFGPRSRPNQHPWPHLVLLDLNLPRLGGLELLRGLRENQQTRLLPVVILTSSLEEQDIVQSYRWGANSYICKLIDFERFSQVIRKVVEYWLFLNQLPPQETRSK